VRRNSQSSFSKEMEIQKKKKKKGATRSGGKGGGRATERTLAFVSSAACVIVGVAFVALTLAGFEPD